MSKLPADNQELHRRAALLQHEIMTRVSNHARILYKTMEIPCGMPVVAGYKNRKEMFFLALPADCAPEGDPLDSDRIQSVLREQRCNGAALIYPVELESSTGEPGFSQPPRRGLLLEVHFREVPPLRCLLLLVKREGDVNEFGPLVTISE